VIQLFAFAMLPDEWSVTPESKAGADAKLDRYVGYYEPYYCSHDTLIFSCSAMRSVISVWRKASMVRTAWGCAQRFVERSQDLMDQGVPHSGTVGLVV
jgi:hypothetical protein